jgi:hypothetical protein
VKRGIDGKTGWWFLKRRPDHYCGRLDGKTETNKMVCTDGIGSRSETTARQETTESSNLRQKRNGMTEAQ